MRNLLMAVAAISLFTASTGKAEQTFVEACLSQTKILESTLTCTMTTLYDNSSMTFTLVKGEKIYLKATGIFGKLDQMIPVQRIQNLPARLIETGVIDHSIRFVGQGSKILATLSIPCGQSQQAAIGLIKAKSMHLPAEYMTTCSIR